jgi:hypothetical protein
MVENENSAVEWQQTCKAFYRALVRLDELELELACYGRLFAPEPLLDEYSETRRELEQISLKLAGFPNGTDSI